ncbi:uncharacterized protein RJT20DRAFT_40129 [Scheffersomyces xylosifermentans]|uniref:uncharacterized protein n=1 Tax=Scheffersomyces xylosifermentans TaxID=1304137 RepID=UPI00315DB35A
MLNPNTRNDTASAAAASGNIHSTSVANNGVSGLNISPISPRNSFSSTPNSHIRDLRSRASISTSNPLTGNYTTNSASSLQRSPTFSSRTIVPSQGKRYSFSDYNFPPSPNNMNNGNNSTGVYNNEQIIDLMEREQDAIVLKLMREIEALKHENRFLKMGGNSASINTTPVSSTSSLSTSIASINNNLRRSSLSSNRSSISSIGSINSSMNQPQHSIPSQVQNINQDTALQVSNSGTKRNNSCSNQLQEKKCKVDSSKYEEIIDENKALRRELNRLQKELEVLRRNS